MIKHQNWKETRSFKTLQRHRQSSKSPPSIQVRILWRQPQTNRWIRSFLENRKQSVILERTVSKQVSVLSGVPQGIVPGPLLFLAYINDMPETETSSETKLFADDSLLYRTINNQTDSDLLQRDLTILEDWENKWQICFNAKYALSSEQHTKKQQKTIR